MDERYLTSFEDQTSALGYTSGYTTLVSPQVSLVGADEVVYSKEIPNESRIRFAKDETTGKLYFVVDGVLYAGVDLGLPSGTIWADKNVGAETPQDNGLYFDWGNVEGHAVGENGSTVDGYSFDRDAYSTTLGGQYTGSTLDAEHDAATVNMGDEWRMPTRTEVLELVGNTDHYYIDESGNTVEKDTLDGSKLRSICFVKQDATFNYNDRSNFIEIPFAGCRYDSLFGENGYTLNVWSSSADDTKYAYNMTFRSNGTAGADVANGRYNGFSVRGVRA